MTPNFLVVGAGRSGTTGLIEGLRQHPDVFVTTPKEPHYFAYPDQQLDWGGPGDHLEVERAVTRREDYLRLYPEHGSHVARGEGSVTSLYRHEVAIPEIQQLAPDARIVILLREPVDRAQSAFDYLSVQGFEPCGSLLDAVADEDRRVAENWLPLWHYTRMSTYADSVEAYLDAFGPDRVGIWFYDELQADYAGVLREVLRFLGTEEHPDELGSVPVVNVSGKPRSERLQSVIQAARGNDRVRRFVKAATPLSAREAVRRRLVRRNQADLEVRRALEPLFADDLARLQQLIPAKRQPDWLAAVARPVS